MNRYTRPLLAAVTAAVERTTSVFQVLAGPRQVGKTTIAKQVMSSVDMPSVYASADSALPLGPEWVETHWRNAVVKAGEGKPVLLVLDEVQKVRGWSEELKRLWDGRESCRVEMRLLVLGSSVLLLRQGLADSLAGRFFLHRCPHWSFAECRDAFGWGLDQWLYFGGYPGAASFAGNESDWRQYVSESLVETVLARDVIQMERVAKPALLRHLFALAAVFPAQVFSYNKMLGQLHDAGNVTTLANYLRILESAMLVSGLDLFWRGRTRKRGSSPKLVVWNNALVNAMAQRSYQQSLSDAAWRGRLVENAVGAHLLNSLPWADMSVTYWREGHDEVDFVVTHGATDWAIEVKSGREKTGRGLEAFRRSHPDCRSMLIGGAGIPLEEFFLTPAVEWFR